MRRLALAGLAMVAVPALAFAGSTVTSGNDTLKIKAGFKPAEASKKKGPLRPIAVKYHYWAGTTNDQRLPDVRSVRAYLGGAKFAFNAFKKCDETDASEQGSSVCPKGSRVASGTAIAEVHPPDDKKAKQDVAVDVTVFNGKLETDRDGAMLPAPRNGLLIYTEVAGTKIALPFWAERRNRGVGYYNPEEDSDPGTEALYTIKEIHLDFDRKTRRRNGRRIPFIGAPRRCKGSWTVTTTNDRYKGGELTAKHKVRCSKAG